MTAAFLRAPIMRPRCCCWAVLQATILAAVLLTLNADSEDSKCYPDIIVYRNTAYNALLGEHVRINCTIQFCNKSPPSISWYKFGTPEVLVINSSRIKMDWKLLKQQEGLFFLSFHNILESDSGQYRCRAEGSVSHSINVTVNGSAEITDDAAHKNGTALNFHTDDIWMYVYTAAGIVAFVVVVTIVSVTAMRGCRGKSKKETQVDKLCVTVPMVEHPFAQASPKGSPSVPPPSWRSAQRETLPLAPNRLPPPRVGKANRDRRERQRERNAVKEEQGSVVYAALNHQPPTGAAARPRRPKEESSEYAAIRVKE